jgi:mannose/fructose/N-acetylgalactosamine-specific phosphotransferase system component IID
VVARQAIPGFGRAVARLFTIQAAWTYERMLGIGFGYVAEPMLRGMKRDGGRGNEAFRSALARQARFFNAHPYFASLAVGAAVRAELDGVQPERIERLRSALAGPLGSFGDRLIWAGWLPACAAVGLILVALGAGLWAPLAFLLLYNAAHVSVRVWGLRAGFRSGIGVAGALAAPGLQRALEIVAPVAAFLVGGALVSVLAWIPVHARWETVAGAGAALVVAAAVRLVQPRATGMVVAGGVLAAVLLVGVLW